MRKKWQRQPLLARQSLNLVISYLLWACDSQIAQCFNMKGCPRLSYPFLYLRSRQASFLRTKGLMDWALLLTQHTHVGCSDVQPKHCPENFVKQSITTLPDGLKKSAGWSRLLPAMHRWSEYGLQMLRKLYQGRNCRRKDQRAPLPPLTHICAHTHRVHMQSEQQENCQLSFFILDLLKTCYKATRIF